MNSKFCQCTYACMYLHENFKVTFIITNMNVGTEQGCQMVCFQTQKNNLGKFWRALEWKILVYFMVIWNILRSFRIFMTIW
jgi:hypothetical protein